MRRELDRIAIRQSNTVYHYEISIAPYGDQPIDTKYCFSSTLGALNKARQLKKEHDATSVRVENGETGRVYFV